MAQDYVATNRTLWNAWARRHVGSPFYDVAGFRAGGTSLREVELAELGEVVAGRTLLHLQCHFGQDTLSWARLGARVTGVDLSPEAIGIARSLAEELAIPAEFICSDLYGLPEVLDRRFDVVYASYGVLCWLHDLDAWARLVYRYLEPGGTFYIVEFHPVLGCLDDDGERIERRCLANGEADRYVTGGSYAAGHEDEPLEAVEWPHGLGEIVTALVSAGLCLEYLHEFPYSVWNYWANAFEEHGPGRYGLRGRRDTLPMMFSIRAHKDA